MHPLDRKIRMAKLPPEKRREALQRTRELAELTRSANRKAMQLLYHPDATVEMIMAARQAGMESRAKLREMLPKLAEYGLDDLIRDVL